MGQRQYLEQHIPEATHPRVRNSQQGHTYMVLQCKEKLQPLLHQDKEAPHQCKYQFVSLFVSSALWSQYCITSSCIIVNMSMDTFVDCVFQSDHYLISGTHHCSIPPSGSHMPSFSQLSWLLVSRGKTQGFSGDAPLSIDSVSRWIDMERRTRTIERRYGFKENLCANTSEVVSVLSRRLPRPTRKYYLGRISGLLCM